MPDVLREREEDDEDRARGYQGGAVLVAAPVFAAGEGPGLEHVGAVVARSTRHLVTDARFAAILEEDFGISSAQILRALEREPRRQAIEMCAWAEKTREPSKALTNWARKHRKGAYGPRRRHDAGVL